MKSIASTVLLVALMAGPAFAQAPAAGEAAPDPVAALQAFNAEAAPKKREFVQEQLALTEAEAKAFWPVYDAHQAALTKLNERRLANIGAYADIWNAEATDEKAMAAVATEALDIEKDEAALMETTYNKLKGDVSVVKAVRYLQLESKLRALIKVELAARIPYAH
jgi:Spy/CpxP family protein refolding chaperone